MSTKDNAEAPTFLFLQGGAKLTMKCKDFLLVRATENWTVNGECVTRWH